MSILYVQYGTEAICCSKNCFWKFLIVRIENVPLKDLNETQLGLLSIVLFKYPTTKAQRVQTDQKNFIENLYI